MLVNAIIHRRFPRVTELKMIPKYFNQQQIIFNINGKLACNKF